MDARTGAKSDSPPHEQETFELKRVRLLAALTPLYFGRTAGFISETLDMTTDQAERVIDDQARQFEELNAPLWVQRARTELSRSSTAGRSEASELTDSERRVAELVASGMSNREVAETLFVSVKTVETNLTRAYRKLGIRSRAQLSAQLRRG